MARESLEQQIDELYQLPLNDFTPQRNALAKTAGGEQGKRVRALPKPSAAAWAVNQLYWQDRPTYDSLIEAAQRLRAAHRAVLGGRKADLRAADAAHRDAVKAALNSTLQLARATGQTISPATQTEIARSLESLPSDDAPGRLAKPLSPAGFAALQGMPIRAPIRAPEAAPAATARPVSEKKPDKAAEARKRKEARLALEAARQRERRDRAAVAQLRKQLAAAERNSEVVRRRLDAARKEEEKLKSEVREAEESLERSEAAVREAASEA